MKISLNWLNDFVDLRSCTIEDIATTLSGLGFGVKDIQSFNPFKGEMLVGFIIETIQHPSVANHKVCQVNIGKRPNLTIVCGAANARVGLTVAVATRGSKLSSGLAVEETLISGQLSQALLCSEKDLGLSEHNDLIELPLDLEAGTLLVEEFNFNDTVFNLDIPPNRGDCLSYLGIARELAAKLKTNLTYQLDCESAPFLDGKEIKVTIEHKEDCPRYLAAGLKNINWQPSPVWLAMRLKASGLTTLNLINDATNYVMLELGQPVQAIDARHIPSSGLRVRRALAGEVYEHGEKQWSLGNSDIVIDEIHGKLSLAGITRGENSLISADTQNIVLEAYELDPEKVRATALRLGVITQASLRYERQTDAALIPAAILKSFSIIRKATLTPPSSNPPELSCYIDRYPEPLRQAKIALRLARARQILGLPLLTLEECITLLDRLSFKCLDHNESRILVSVPSFRRDIEREIDLIRELSRHIGWDNLNQKLPMMEIKPNYQDPFYPFLELVKASLAQCGMIETIHAPLISTDDRLNFQMPPAIPALIACKEATQGSLSWSLSFSLLPNLCKTLRLTKSQGTQGSQIFELHRCFLQGQESLPQGRHIKGSARTELRPIERHFVAALIDQPWMRPPRDSPALKATLTTAQHLLQSLLHRLGIAPPQFEPFDACQYHWLKPDKSSKLLLNNQAIGYCGELNHLTALAYGFKPEETPVAFEVDLDALYDQRESKPPTYFDA